MPIPIAIARIRASPKTFKTACAHGPKTLAQSKPPYPTSPASALLTFRKIPASSPMSPRPSRWSPSPLPRPFQQPPLLPYPLRPFPLSKPSQCPALTPPGHPPAAPSPHPAQPQCSPPPLPSPRSNSQPKAPSLVPPASRTLALLPAAQLLLLLSSPLPMHPAVPYLPTDQPEALRSPLARFILDSYL